ncbi:MAG: serine O-acetyltransferase [Phycisphaerales bacterium]
MKDHSPHSWLPRAVEAMLASIRSDDRTARLVPEEGSGGCGTYGQVPNIRAIDEVVKITRRLAFPGYFEERPLREQELPLTVAGLLGRLSAHLVEQVQIVLRYAYAVESPGRTRGTDAPGNEPNPWAHWMQRLRATGMLAGALQEDTLDCELIAQRVTERFILRLPEVRRLLALDVQAAFDGDPAAEHADEIILCYPGLLAVFHHRIAHELYRAGVPLLPRIIAEESHRQTGIDIHPGARIGERFFIDHGAGTVVGETTDIGSGVRIYQGVTLGARSFDRDEGGVLIRGTKRHPTVGDRVTIYAGAVILGGETVIGDDCVINGGVFVTSSMPPGHIVRQKQAELTLRSNPELRGRPPGR